MTVRSYTYQFRKGSFQPEREPFVLIGSNRLSGTISIPASSAYSLTLSKDTNKLVRLLNSFHHHISSCGIAWRPSVGAYFFEGFAYCYWEGIRYAFPLGKYKYDHDHEFLLQCRNRSFLCQLGSQFDVFPIYRIQSPVKYIHAPRFGGDLPAFHDHSISITYKY